MDIRLNQMVNYLQGKFNKPSAEEQDREALRQLVQRKRRRRLVTRTTAEWWWRAWAI